MRGYSSQTIFQKETKQEHFVVVHYLAKVFLLIHFLNFNFFSISCSGSQNPMSLPKLSDSIILPPVTVSSGLCYFPLVQS